MKKIILITGTSTGFGTLMAKTFAQEGHTVIATMRHVNGKNATSAATLSTIPNIEVIDLDVTDDDSVNKAVAAVLDKHGKIDVLINNAGIAGTGLLEAYTVPQIQRMFDVNVWGVLRMNNAVLPAMRKSQNGLIITVTSIAGRVSTPFRAVYSASKFALEGFLEGAYGELIGEGIESVMIEPGAFITEIMNKPGINADREGIQEAYGDAVRNVMQQMTEVFTKLLSVPGPRPQLVADVALRLVNMDKGKRPLRTPVDPLAKGLDHEYNDTTEEIKKRWYAVYGL
jgi:NADP-dependent 3-hydroxy acid dehydrogenase YdfG